MVAICACEPSATFVAVAMSVHTGRDGEMSPSFLAVAMPVHAGRDDELATHWQQSP